MAIHLFFSKKAILFLATVLLANSIAFSQIIPEPVTLVKKQGYFEIDHTTSILFNHNNKAITQLASYFQQKIKAISKYQLPLNTKSKKVIALQHLKEKNNLGKEGYQLLVTPQRIQVKYNSKEGAFYAIQSLLQLLPMAKNNAPLKIKCVKIIDYPRYPWRGMMLDVSRHFFTVDAIKQTLDMLAFYKINVFHWHLCDNEGWRLEIKKYPKLTNIGAWRNEIPKARMYQKDTIPKGEHYKYGGFYTQKDAKEIVTYAKKLNITVIPEIEMPGHSGAALAAYPEYSCSQKPQKTPNSILHYTEVHRNSFSLNYCAGNENTFSFLKDILTEVMEIFPSAYIHIGGDEVKKDNWKTCKKCQHKIKIKNLKNEDELQSYFIKRIEKFLLQHNRKLLGWDEILEGGLAPSATVMSWRGEKGGVESAKMKHFVVMAPNNPLYFLRHQDKEDIGKFHAPTYSINSLDRVYNYNPYSQKLSKEENAYIFGSQFSVWTEFISSVPHLQYMIFPRMTAFAEAVWSPTEKKDFNNFVKKLNQYHFDGWKLKGIKFHPKFYKKTAY